MTWTAPTSPSQYTDAVGWFAKRKPLLKSEWQALGDRAKRQGFTVAGVAQLSIVADVHAEVAKAIADGETLEAFKARVKEKLEREWTQRGGPTDEAAASRIALIFRNATAHAYSAGRWLQATAPDTLKVRPYWLYDATRDGRTSPICKALDGTILPADDEFWSSHVPPCHHGCRSSIVTLTEKQAAREGGATSKPPTTLAQAGFGLPPERSEWSPDPKGYPPALWTQFETQQRQSAKAAPSTALCSTLSRAKARAKAGQATRVRRAA